MPASAIDDILFKIPVLKCVVVGDTAVGKTKLICHQTQGTVLNFDQITAKHVPTIWAIDHYRKNREVQIRSILDVDGVKMSLHLWDTFGDHDKDRKYAYQKASVAILCYDVSNPKSFQHVQTKWYPEIRRFCPNVPILLLGCKNDMRYLYNDLEFKQYCKDKNPYIKKVPEENMISREQGRQMAQEIGATCYYEVSAFTEYGMDFIFENIVRIGLISRRREKFWIKKWRNIASPAIQTPYCPPKPDEPVLKPASPSRYRQDITNMMRNDYGQDYTLFFDGNQFYVHRIILTAVSSYFRQIFMYMESKEISGVELPLIARMGLELCGRCISFHYTGYLEFTPKELLANYIDIRNITEVEELTDMIYCIDTEDIKEVKECVYQNFASRLKNSLYDLGLKKQLFVDVGFKVEDGMCYAHRCILLARCEFMRTMFSENFIERSLEIVSFPDTTKEAFDIVLQYLYTDSVVGSVNIGNSLEVIVLANRLCLFRLVALVEGIVIESFKKRIENNKPIYEYVLLLLEPSALHNAFQLYDFCQYYIITNYHEISIFSTDTLEELSEETQANLKKFRWPPVEVRKEQMMYEQLIRETERALRRTQRFAFWKRAGRNVGAWFRSATRRRLLQNVREGPENSAEIATEDSENVVEDWGNTMEDPENDTEDAKNTAENAADVLENVAEDPKNAAEDPENATEDPENATEDPEKAVENPGNTAEELKDASEGLKYASKIQENAAEKFPGREFKETWC